MYLKSLKAIFLTMGFACAIYTGSAHGAASQNSKSPALPTSYEASVLKSLMDAAQAEVTIQLTEAVLSLGWEKEFAETDHDLAKFAEKYREFHSLFQGTSLLILSEELSRGQKIENLLYAPIHYGYLTAKEAYESTSLLKTAFLLSILAPNAAVGISYIPIIAPTFVGKKLLARLIWGAQIDFADQVPQSELSNSTAFLYCKNSKIANDSFWLDDDKGNLLTGSWGHDQAGSGFATQTPPVSLLSRCAAQMRAKFNIRKLRPDEVIPAVAVSLMHSETLYSEYPITYYSMFTDQKGNAVKMTSYFKH